LSSTQVTSFDIWYHVVATYHYVADGTSVMNMYVNGVQDATQITTAHGPINTTTAPLTIGVDNYADPTRFFAGTLDDVRIYNRTLSASEVQQLYNLGR
jgi:hypothetical protein